MRPTGLITLGLVTFAALAGCGAAQVRARRDPRLVTLDGALANRYVPSGARSPVVARVRIGTVQVDPSRRPPINLALVVDTSGSMEGRAIDDARAASLALLDTLAPTDRLAVVVFHSRAEIVLPSGVLDDDHRALARTRIRAMRAQGTTEMAGGLRLAMGELFNHYDSAAINRVVLLGDGVPNNPEGIEQTAQALGSRGVTVTALGLGQDYDETLMGAIAQRSGGRFHYIEQSSQVAAVFRDEVLRIQRVVGRNAVAVLTPGPGVQLEAVVGQASERVGNAVRVPVGDVTEGEARDLIVRATVEGRRDGASVEIMDVALEFDDAVGGSGRLERRVFLGARSTGDDATLTGGRNQEVERDAARITLAAGTVEAIREARNGNVEQAQGRLDTLIEDARASAREYSFGDDALAAQTRSVAGLRAALPSLQASTGGATPVAVAPARPSAAAEAPSVAPAQVVRQAHDEAMRTLNGY